MTDSYWYESKIKMTYEGKKRSDGYDYVHHGPWVSKTGRFVASVICHRVKIIHCSRVERRMAQRQTIIIVYHDSQLRLMKTNEAAATEAARMNKKSSSAPSDNKTISQRKVN